MKGLYFDEIVYILFVCCDIWLHIFPFFSCTRQARKGENANEVTRLKYYWSTQPKNRCFLFCTVKFIHMHERKDSFTMQFQWDKARKRTKQLLNWRKHVASVCIRLRLLFVLSVLSVVESFCTYVYPDWLTYLLGDTWYRYTCTTHKSPDVTYEMKIHSRKK